ncbi:MAG: family 1 glycosylhydrolase [Candidatus Marinimicrobia bacterium]|nr:family 1 glycosylhydrolase [Candidatus Neomarinimicrobiota bacterium]
MLYARHYAGQRKRIIGVTLSFPRDFIWVEGLSKRFGLVYVNYVSGRRIQKDSATWYKKCIVTNGKNLNVDLH